MCVGVCVLVCRLVWCWFVCVGVCVGVCVCVWSGVRLMICGGCWCLVQSVPMMMLYFMSFLLRPPGSNVAKWFKFDDGEVSEAKLDDEEVSSTHSIDTLWYSSASVNRHFISKVC